MKIRATLVLLSLVLILSGCNIENEESQQHTTTNTSTTITTSETIITTTTSETSSTEITEPLEPDEVIPEAVQTPRVEGNRLSYSIRNIYSEGEYYTVDISGVRMPDNTDISIDTTYINGEIYGDFRFDLYKMGELIDSYKINVPRDDRFLILESVIEDLHYGCELISNRRIFDAVKYPDLIQLDFHIINEVEAPQYARFFSIFDGKIVEVPVYQDGIEAAPYGTHMETTDVGVMVQQLVAQQYNGNYTVIQYEYTFDVQDRCLNRKQVRFTGRRD